MDSIEYINNQNRYVFPFKITKNNKKRTIITYTNDSFGYDLRNHHNNIMNKLNNIKSSKLSFAYKKGLSTKDCFNDHKNSNLFIKLDIHNFFESIILDKFIEIAGDLLADIDLEDIKSCFYDNHISLGFVTSPKISDIYLYGFDKKIEEYLKEFNFLHYSRYCDDILISTEENTFASLHTFESYIEKCLKEYNLTLNKEKLREFDLDKVNSVRFVGLNYVKKDEGFVITISKYFIVKTLSMIEKNEKLKDEKLKKYLGLGINSRVSYIKYNSELSYQRFLKKYKNRFKKEWVPYGNN